MSRRPSVWVLGVLCALASSFLLAGIASADTLPDGRLYEQVTPEEKYGSDVYQPPVWKDTHDEYEVTQSREASSTEETGLTFQAAANGDGIAFVAAPTVGGNANQGASGGNEYLARRSVSGWDETVLSPEGAPSSLFQAFSPDLTKGFANSVEPLSSTAPGFGETFGSGGSYDVLYTVGTADGEYVPFFSNRPPYRSTETFGTAGPINELGGGSNSGDRGKHSGYLEFEGASTDGSHLLFGANDALTEASEGRPAAEGGSDSQFETENNLYESINGRLRLVNVLPDGTTHANATFGGIEKFGLFATKRNILDRVISADGSRIFWTDLSTGHLYMREGGDRTVEVSAQGTYQTAATDGSKAFYTNGDLYGYEVASGDTTDLTPGVPVERVIGASENGEYIYYLTNGKTLALWHGGVSTQITSTPIRISEEPVTAEVTPDGHSIVFTREEAKAYPVVGNNYVQRVEVYDAGTNTLYCASCTSGGTLGRLPVTNHENVYQPRWISANGAHVFFVSQEGLVPQDTNETQDVYEWERPSTEACTESTGCVYLLSGGASTANSSFLDASQNGNDVFIVTREKLVGGDEDDLFDVYDVGVRSPLVAPPVCTGTGCQGVPNPTPIFATPSSVTFEGVGNFAVAAKEAEAKPKAKKKPKHKKGKKRGMRKTKAKKSARRANGLRRSSPEEGRS